MDFVIDLDQVREQRRVVPLARAANALLATASQLSNAGIEADTLLRAMTIALSKVIAETADPDVAARNAESVCRTLPDLVGHLTAKPG
jgi:hypothetical protein